MAPVHETTTDEAAAEGVVPEPNGVMLLAAGAAGLGLWRRRRAGQAA